MNAHKQFEIFKCILKNRNKISFNVSGNCMKGTIEEGSSIKVSSIDDVQNIKIGDILAVFKHDKYYAHRVVDIIYDYSLSTKEVFILKGDNNFIVDQPVIPKEIIGIIIN